MKMDFASNTFEKMFRSRKGFDVVANFSAHKHVRSEKAELLKEGSTYYPVHYSNSDTSGEKAYEEFYTEVESVDMLRLKSLGVVTGKGCVDKNKIERLFYKLEEAFEQNTTTKEEIVNIIEEYLPNFNHIEKGKSLDSKM